MRRTTTRRLLLVLGTVVLGLLRAAVWLVQFILVPVLCWLWRTLSSTWQRQRHRRVLRRASRQFHLTRRQRRHLADSDPGDLELVHRALWWCLWVIAHEVPAIRVAERMEATDRGWDDVIGYVAAQAYTIPTRHPQHIDAAVWAHELRSLQGLNPILPEINP